MNETYYNVENGEQKASPPAEIDSHNEAVLPTEGDLGTDRSASADGLEVSLTLVPKKDEAADDGEDEWDETESASESEGDDLPAETGELALGSGELSREELFQRELAELAQKHAEEVALNVERAKDRSLYDTYQSVQAEMDEKIKIFSARRRGRSHIRGDLPCQDYCLTADTPKGVILTDADGVGSCSRSDVGSRLACEVTVEFIRELDGQCENEEQFVTRLCSLRFRELLVKRWMQAVLAHAKENPDDTVLPNRMYELYGSTLLFAVITENYYVVGNLGDGQILLFNDAEGFKLRLHPPKESTKVRALAHSNCYREDFQVGVYSRREFSGILLTTDGMYDVLSNGTLLYHYARQLERRFLEAGEPLQPFCFEEEDQPPKDLFSHRTKDDCSIVLAVDTAFASESTGLRMAALGEGADAVIPDHRCGEVACYWIEQNQEEYWGVVLPETETIAKADECPVLSGVDWVVPLRSWCKDGDRYAIYAAIDAPTIEELYHYGILREQSERTNNASQRVLAVYQALLSCKRQLAEQGYRLSAAAPHLMRISQEGRITLPLEAVVPLGEGSFDNFAHIDRYFQSLAGKIVSDEGEYPLFRLGFLNMGQRLYLSDRMQNPAYRIARDAEGNVWLVNLGDLPWYTRDGAIVPGEKILLREGMTFGMITTNDELITYRYISKEEM